MEILEPRDVPLGGLRAMNVRRTLPQRRRSLIGAWCFVDHYGPDDLATDEPMVVPPHPHTGLSTVSWLFAGEVEHRDSAGNHAIVRPGELNLMTAGRGISHSEYSAVAMQADDAPASRRILHGCQLWLALPDASRDIDPDFEHYAPGPVSGPGWEARVFLGSLLGSTSPVRTHSPLIGAELVLAAGVELEVPVDPAYEHGLLLDSGDLIVDGDPLDRFALGYLATGRPSVRLHSRTGARVLLLGGTPFGEEIVMWWNFIGRSHEEIVGFREEWERLVGGSEQERFALPADDPRPALNAPALPNARLRPRR